jgi:uncharacterized protein YdgA (DUF945 family)
MKKKKVLGEKKMKKGILGLILIVVLGYGGATFYFGGQAQSQLKRNVLVFNDALQKQMQDAPGPKFQVSLVDYSKGFLSSSARLKFTLDMRSLPVPLPGGQAVQSYEMPMEIHHGPFIFSLGKMGLAYATTTARFPEKMAKQAKMFLSESSELPELQMSVFIKIDESFRVDADVPKFQIEPKAGMQGNFIWKGMNAVYNVSSNMVNVDGGAVIEGLSLDSPMAKADVSKIEMNYDVSKAEYDLWVGTGDMSVPSIDVSFQGMSIFSLADLSFESKAGLDDGLLSMDMRSSMKKAMVRGQNYGPLKFALSIKNLDAKTFASVQKLAQQLNNSRYLPRSQSRELMQKLEQQLPSLVNKGAELDLDKFTFTIPQGEIAADVNAKVAKGVAMKSILELANHVVINAEIKLPKVIVEKALIKRAASYIRHQQMRQQLENANKQEAASGDGSDDTMAQGQDNMPKPMSRSEIRDAAKEKVTNQIQRLVDKDLLVQTDSSYIFKFKYDKGLMYLNGAPISKDMLEQDL